MDLERGRRSGESLERSDRARLCSVVAGKICVCMRLYASISKIEDSECLNIVQQNAGEIGW